MYKYKLAILVTPLVTRECAVESRRFNDIRSRNYGVRAQNRGSGDSGGEPVAASKITKGDKTESGGGILPRGVIKH